MHHLRTLLVFVLSCVFFTHATAQGPLSCCDVPGWTYVRDIEINNSGNPARTNYQVLLIINTQTPITQGKMKPNGSDIRFATTKCGPFLNYWIENGINTNTTEIWVLVPSIPANGLERLYMYYGNPAATATSSFPSVFTNVLTISGAQTLNGIQSAQWIDIDATAVVSTTSTVTFTARKVKVSGSINGDFRGYGPGSGPGTGGNGGGDVGGGGAGYGGRGGSGGSNQGFGGPIYGTTNGSDIDRGSGGAGSDCNASAAGGGAVTIDAASVEINGSISVRGQSAQNCCCNNDSEAAGGGSGGGILMLGDYIKGNGALNAAGGNGGDSDDKEGGGGGGGGRIKFLYAHGNVFNGTTNVNGGQFGNGPQGGEQPGQPGTVADVDLPNYITIRPEKLIRVIPVADFSAASVCSGTPAVFNDLSTIASGAIAGWQWDFGDAQTSTQQSPSHSYATAGNYNVTLTISSDSTCSHVVTKQVTVFNGPTAAFNFTNVCSGTPVDFTDASTITAPAIITTWAWDFGDAQTSALPSPTHNYTAAGTYNVALTVTANNQCANTITQQVTVSAMPAAAFTFANACFGAPVSFTDASTIPAPSTITTWSWDFGDAQTSAQQNPTHSYATSGTYNVALTVSAGGACTHTATQQLTLYAAPTIAFNFSDACLGSPVNFTDASTVGAPYVISSWSWDFGDTQTSTQQNPSYTYTTPGSFDVTLAVTTDANCQNTLTQTVQVFPSLTVSLTPTHILCEGVSTGAIDAVVTGGTAAFNYSWSNNATTQNLTAIPAGTYTLTVTDANSCDAIAIAVVTEPTGGIAITNEDITHVTCFGDDDGSIELTVSGGTAPYDFSWSNNATSASNNGLLADDYDVTITDANGCPFIASYTITEPPFFSLDVSPDTTIPFGTSLPLTAQVSPADPAAEYSWSPSLYLSCSDCANPQVTGIDSITYYITATNANGCPVTGTVTIDVKLDKVLYIPNVFTPNNDGTNDVFSVYTFGDKRFKMAIYDRWGGEVFVSENKDFGWNGRAGDKEVNSGVYVYDVFIEYLDRSITRKQGSVAVVR